MIGHVLDLVHKYSNAGHVLGHTIRAYYACTNIVQLAVDCTVGEGPKVACRTDEVV